jgi:choline transport protein
MPLLARLLSLIPSISHAPAHPSNLAALSSFSLGKAGPYINGLGLIFLLFGLIDFQFPQVGPVDAENMNYCSAAIGVIALVSLVTWIVDGRKNFRGPEIPVEGLALPVGMEEQGTLRMQEKAD